VPVQPSGSDFHREDLQPLDALDYAAVHGDGRPGCFRLSYWGQGIWTEYARELCRRASDILTHDFR